jgi:hypothetical protein
MFALAQRNVRPFLEPEWHARFLAMVPTIRRYAHNAFRTLPSSLRDERIDDVVVNTLVAYSRLVQAGKEDLAYPTVLARYGVAQVSAGRRVGNRSNCRELLSRCAQKREGFSVKPLDRFNAEAGEWREAVLEDRRMRPADVAAFRIDFPEWLRSLSRRNRQIALKLAIGESTGAVAKLFRLSAARVSQVRGELHAAWLKFHGEEDAAGATVAVTA